MKKYIIKFILIILPIATIIIINLLVDPMKLFFANRFTRRVSKILSAGNNVVLYEDYSYDQRLLQKYWIESMRTCPSLVVLGSSRVSQVRERFFKGEELINNYVNAATLEDIIAIYGLYESRGFKPCKIMLGLDSWILNDNHGQTGWMSIYDEFLRMNTKLQGPHWKRNIFKDRLRRFHKLLQLLSPGYFRESIHLLWKEIHSGHLSSFFVVNNYDLKYFTKLSDGSVIFSRQYREVSAEQADLLAEDYIKNMPIAFYNKFRNISKIYLYLLDSFINYLYKNKIQIEFILPPYHPKVYDYLIKSDSYRIVAETEKYFRALAQKYNIKVIGSFNPTSCHLGRGDFLDGAHFKESAISTILEQ